MFHDFTSEDFDLPIKGEMKLFVLENITMTMRIVNPSFGEFEIDIASSTFMK
jgi:hypothetical protein